MSSFSIFSRACTRRTISTRPALSTTERIAQSQRQPQRRCLSQTTSIQSSSTSALNSSASDTSPLPPPELFDSPSTTKATAPHNLLQQQQAAKLLTGTVTRTGTMQSCIQITHMSQKYDKHLQKHYTRPNRLLVHDPNPTGYLRKGDVIEYSAWTTDEKEARVQRKQEFETKSRTTTNTDANNDESSTSSTTATAAKKRQGRRFMTGKKTKGNHGTGAEKWVGPRYVFRRVVTPFGTGLDQRMEQVVRAAESARLVEAERVQFKGGKRGNQSNKPTSSARIAG